jgi:outer membrane protein OmpA-like peptidoglycan-associated protein
MKIQTLAILAATASLFAQTELSCRTSFNAVKNSLPRDAATDRMYAIVDARIQTLEKVPASDRKEPQFQAELRTCDLSVELFKTQLERVDLTNKYAAVQKQIYLTKDSLILLWSNNAESLRAALGSERSLLEQSKRALAEKDSLLAAQKAEAQKKLDALNSRFISVYKDARGTILSMSDILFDFGKATLKQELKDNLTEVAAILKTLLAESNVEVEGHTDNVGKEEANKILSEQRAKAVMDHLISRGVEASRLESVGYGLTRPVADNSTDEGRAKNRRVELVIKDR